MRCCRGMIERKSGAILNVASTAAFQPGPGMAVYFATKAFVLSFSEALHEEVKGRGDRQRTLPWPDRDRVRRSRRVRGQQPVEQGLRPTALRWSRAGLEGLDKRPGDRHPWPDEQIDGPGPPFLPAQLGAKSGGRDQAVGWLTGSELRCLNLSRIAG